ncbi:hypothetical protein GOBAR_AA40172 [Gossypium barbadense]|uniref:eRF1/Pelota-like N-terminal domain-containing protein n=1 Tax=Gossypium barbadense TaxID=3634 RepID=A0A2P5VP22_GOSBA|nr:hypothetical protein GOBAR_AA40172 [Gossypium barbadense]
MIPVDSEDLWFAYNLIATGDWVMSRTVRKVLRETAGGRDAERVALKLEIKVEAIDYDKEGSVLRIRGKNTLENEHVKIGQFHTLELELQRPFVLRKKIWDSLALDVLRQASELISEFHLCLMANSCYLGERISYSFTTTVKEFMIRAVCEFLFSNRLAYLVSVKLVVCGINLDPGASADLAVALKKFFENVLQAFLKHVDFNVVRCAVIASPGFTKEQFHRHLMLEAERRQLRPIIENKSRIILVHTSSGYKHSLREVLDAPNVMSMIKDTKAAQEVRALKDFFNMLSNDPARACYGPKHVEIAHERMAVQTLLITDDLFRNSDVITRQKYVSLVNSVKNSGGTAHIFSSMHVSGEQLAQLTGIAAILRFPLPDLEDIEM